MTVVIATPSLSTSERTLLQIVQDTMNEIGLPEPSSIIGNTDATVKQMLALANREGKELSDRVSNNEGWPQLRSEYQFDLTSYTGYTGNTVNNSAVVSGMNNTTNLVAGQIFLGSGIPTATRIYSVDSSSQVTLDRQATATATGVSFTASVDRYAFPTDINYWINRTGWDRTRKWELMGPVTAREWQFLKSGYPATGFLYRFRVMAGYVYVDPPPTSVSRIVFEYYTRNWCQSSGGSAQSVWAADTDVPLLPDSLISLGLKWRFLRAKGLDYEQEARTYEDAVERAIGRAGQGRDLPMNSNMTSKIRLIDNGNVSDTGYGS